MNGRSANIGQHRASPPQRDVVNISNHLRAFNRTSVRSGYLLTPILVSVLLVVVTGLGATSVVVTIFDSGEYPYVGNHLNAFGGLKAFAVAAMGGSLFTLALLYLRLLTNDMFEALTEPWFKGRRWKATLIVVIFVSVWLAPPILVKWMTSDPGSPWFRVGEHVATGVEYLNRFAGGIVGLLISVISVIAFYITILQLRDFQSRITSFGELMEKLVELADTATIHDRLHIICYTPAIGFLAESRQWPKVVEALLRRSKEPDGQGRCNRVEMIVPKMEDIDRWHRAFIGRRTKRGIGGITEQAVREATFASITIRDDLLRQGSQQAYREVDFDILPGYYCFFTLRRAILVTPLFVPLLADQNAKPPNLPPPDMIGFSTTDRGVIDSMFDQFDHVLEIHHSRSAP